MITIRKLLLRNMIAVIFAATGSLYLFWIFNEYTAFNSESQRLKTQYVDTQKEFLKNQVATALDYIVYMETQTEARLKKNIQQLVNEAHAIATNIYLQNKEERSETEIKKMILDALRPVRFGNGSGYFFAFTMDGIKTLFPDHPELEGRNMLSVQDPNGQFVVKDMIDILHRDTQGYYRYAWTKPDENALGFEKIAYVKYFKPYDWGIGTGLYVDDMKTEVQEDVLFRISTMRFGKDGYFFGSVYGGAPLFTNGVITRGGENLWDLTDPDGVKIIQEMDRVARASGDGFVRYSWHKLDSDIPSPKLVYVRTIPEWRWIIGAGLYIDAIDSTILSRKNALYKNFKKKFVSSFFLFLIMSLFSYFWVRHLAHKVHRGIKTFSDFFDKASLTSAQIDPDSLTFDEFRDIAVAANQMVEVRRQTLEALKLNEKRYEKSQALGKVGNWEYHLSTETFWASKETKRIFGFDPEKDSFSVAEVEGCIPEKKKVHKTMMEQVKIKDAHQLEFKIFTRDTGKPKCVITIAELEGDQKGNPLKINGVIQDVTLRKNLEKELLQAHKMEAVGTLSGGVAHEFNNILGVILGNAELAIADISRDESWRHYFDEIKMASLRGKSIVSQLLSFSRRDEHPMQPLKMDKIVKNAITFLRASLPSTIQFNESIQKDCHPVVGDSTQIHQILINLCNNAAHAMESGGGKLSVKLENVLTTKSLRSQNLCILPGEYVRLTVSDTGEGIAEEIIDDIFDPFFTTKPIDKGSGMGLSVVHGIMKAHDGMIKIYSRIDEGTSCECYFPRGKTMDTPKSEPVNSVKTGNETILLVDDDVHIIKLEEQILERLGYHPVTETNPKKALDFFRKNPESFHLVITDMTMPEMTGDQLIEKLREIKPDVKAIICTGYSSRLENMEAVKAEACLMKPFEISVLAETIRKILDN